MIETDSITRVLFEDFRPSAVRLFYVIGFAAIAVFCYGGYVQVRKYRRGVATAPAGDSLAGPRWGFPRWPLGRRSVAPGGSLLTRFGEMVGMVLSHRTVAR